MIKVAVLVGSLREGSYNMMLAKHIMDRYSGKFEFELVNLDLPLYNEDINTDELRPKSVVNFQEAIARNDTILFVSPEYNHSMSAPTKNAIDWGSAVAKGQRGLAKKTGLAMHCSSGMIGGARAHVHLRDSVNTIGMNMLPANEVLISYAQTKFDDNNKLNDEPTIKFIDLVMKHFVDYYEKLQ